MRIGRAVIIPVILALSVAAAALAGSEMAGTATRAPSTHVHVSADSSNPDVMYRG
jgi:hypothetical protein